LQPSEIVKVKSIVQQKVPDGVNSIGLTFPGFIYVHNMFLKKGRTETLWTVLRKFGYDNDLKLRDDFLPVPSMHASDQVILFFFFLVLAVSVVRFRPSCLSQFVEVRVLG